MQWMDAGNLHTCCISDANHILTYAMPPPILARVTGKPALEAKDASRQSCDHAVMGSPNGHVSHLLCWFMVPATFYPQKRSKQRNGVRGNERGGFLVFVWQLVKGSHPTSWHLSFPLTCLSLSFCPALVSVQNN